MTKKYSFFRLVMGHRGHQENSEAAREQVKGENAPFGSFSTDAKRLSPDLDHIKLRNFNLFLTPQFHRFASLFPGVFSHPDFPIFPPGARISSRPLAARAWLVAPT